MWLLVDYGNIKIIDKKRGLAHTIGDLLNRIGADHLNSSVLVNARLYDGWYWGDRPSKNAQLVAVKIEFLAQ